jgi:hypothetical protein
LHFIRVPVSPKPTKVGEGEKVTRGLEGEAVGGDLLLIRQTSNRQHYWGRLLLRTAIVTVVIIVFWLIADLEITGAESPHDDMFFIQAAKNGCWFGDQPYTFMSVIKEPVYPLFVAFFYRLGIPLRMATQAFYLAASGFFCWSLVYRQTRSGIGLIVFAACAFHPCTFAVFQRALYDNIYASLLLVVLGALLLQLKLTNGPGRWWPRLLSGVALGLLWNTRPERALLALLLLVLLAASALHEWRRQPTWRVALRSWFAQWSLPIALLVGVTTAIKSANYARWGAYMTTAHSGPGYRAFYSALLRIKQERPAHRVPVTREALELGYAVSPSLREIRHTPAFADPARSEGTRENFPHVPPGEIVAGWFEWGLLEAAWDAGYQTAADAEAFFFRIANEINTAIADGRLPTRTVLPFVLDPCFENYRHELFPSFFKLWAISWSSNLEIQEGKVDMPETSQETIQAFDQVGCRRSLASGQRFQSVVRSWIGKAYEFGMPRVAGAALLAALVVFLRRDIAGKGWYFLISAVLGFVGFSRLAMLTLVEASAFGGYDPRYLFPAVLVLTIMTVWLMVEGLRLLGMPPEMGGLSHGGNRTADRIP